MFLSSQIPLLYAPPVVKNVDILTVHGFGEEWAAFDQSALPEDERKALFESYFAVFPFDSLPPNAEGFDLGCGSGRWAALMAPRVGTLHCIDPAEKALAVARRNVPNARFHLADAETNPLPDGTQDFGYSLGVLHHVPDTQKALEACVRKLKPGAPFLVYLYYAFDNRPPWYRLLWKASDLVRRGICRLPFPVKRTVTGAIAITVYWPLSRASRYMGPNFPLHAYHDASMYTLRTDALDRFGTRLEKRFTKTQIRQMMTAAGLADIRFSDGIPYWTAVGFKSA
jgi:ubiquinone/menaquinone biosynthesis C-methylase UbiE